MTMRITSFFMVPILLFRPAPASRAGHHPVPPRRDVAQTVRRSRAPVSDDGWRSFDMARASI
jgi:hypothetical protein